MATRLLSAGEELLWYPYVRFWLQELFQLAASLGGGRRNAAAYWMVACARFCTSMLTSCSGDSVSSSMPQLFSHS